MLSCGSECQPRHDKEKEINHAEPYPDANRLNAQMNVLRVLNVLSILNVLNVLNAQISRKISRSCTPRSTDLNVRLNVLSVHSTSPQTGSVNALSVPLNVHLNVWLNVCSSDGRGSPCQPFRCGRWHHSQTLTPNRKPRC